MTQPLTEGTAVRWIQHRQIADLLLSARAAAQHPGYIALQPIIELLEAVAACFAKRKPRDDRSSLPPRA